MPRPSRRSPERLARRLCAAAALATAACAAPYASVPPSPAGAAADALRGRQWTLVELDGRAAVAGLGGETPHLRLRADSARVEGSTGCNTFFGPYARGSGDALRFGPLASTRRACADAEPAAQEARFVAALEATRRHALRGDTLVLLDDAGPRLRLAAAPR